MGDKSGESSIPKHVQVLGSIQVRFTPEFEKEYKAGQEQEHTRETHRFKVEIVTLIVILIYTSVAFWQGCSNQKAAESASTSASAAASSVQVARDTLELENRPWLYIKPIVNYVRFPPNSDGTVAAIELKFSIKNVGKSIAKNIHISAKLVPRPADMRTGMPFALDAASIQKQACDKEERGDMTFNRVAFPVDDPLEITVGTNTSPEELIKNETKIGAQTFVNLNLVGCVSYHSSFNQAPRRTWFSYLVTGPVTRMGEVPISGGFEIGVDSDPKKIGLMTGVFGRNDAD
jgi:hypothetical protein